MTKIFAREMAVVDEAKVLIHHTDGRKREVLRLHFAGWGRPDLATEDELLQITQLSVVNFAQVNKPASSIFLTLRHWEDGTETLPHKLEVGGGHSVYGCL